MGVRMTAQVKSVCFTVDGEWLADFARTRVIEGRWDAAIKLLETLHTEDAGITLDQIVMILKGDATLDGDSNVGIGFKKANIKAHKKQMGYMFGGVWNNAGRYMRPYAMVTSWGPDDMIERLTAKGERWRHSSEYYANDPKRDVLLRLRHDYDEVFQHADILFEEFPNFPHLLVDAYSRMNAQDALDEYLKIRGLDERGYLGGRRHMQRMDDIMSKMGTASTDTAPPAFVPRSDCKTLAEAKAAMREYAEAPLKLTDQREDKTPMFEEADDRSLSPLEQMMKRLREDPITDEQIEGYREKIREQAGDNWLTIGDVRIPQAPFENWCLWRGDGAHLALPWKTVAPSGIKMMGDDPYHTDFMLGAGLDLDAMKDHDDPLTQAIWDLREKVQTEKLGFKCAVLCGTGESKSLKAVHPKKGESCQPDQVAVIPNAGPDYVAAANTAGAVITEQGGAMAHLVTVFREKDVKIVRVKDALKLYPPGMHLIVDCSKGDVHVPYNRKDWRMLIGGAVIDVDNLSGDDE
jgi:phosphohistidine swiveling domain-containing protein